MIERRVGSLAAPDIELAPTCASDDDVRRIATASLFRGEARRLVNMLALVTGDRVVAEDLAQEAFVRTYSAWPRLRSADRAVGYLRATALNLARSRWRRVGVAGRFRPERPAPAEDAHDIAERNELHAAVLAEIRSLPARQRECVILRYYCEMSPDGIADALGLSVNSVKTHLRRGLEALHTRLDRKGVGVR